MLNIALTWGLLYIIIGLAMSIYIEIESPIWKLILYYIGIILFWPGVVLMFLIAILATLGMHIYSIIKGLLHRNENYNRHIH
jgi:hypothetical protein